MCIDLQDIRKDGDEKQKKYLQSLGYSKNVINALFPERNETGIFLDNGKNLIAGFEIALLERKFVNK